jgi:hypothetical protein
MRQPGVTTESVRTKYAAGTNSRLVILPAILQAGKTSSLLQNEQFCPDEGSQCALKPCLKLKIFKVGQFDRTVRSIFKNLMTHSNHLFPLDSCIGPDDFKDLRDSTGRGLNVNGSICLNLVCQYVFAVLYRDTVNIYQVLRYGRDQSYPPHPLIYRIPAAITARSPLL